MTRDEVFTVGQHVAVDVDLPAGSVLIRTGVGGAVSVSVDTPSADSFDIDQLGDTISVRARRTRSARIVVDVPTGSDVSVKGASVSVVARGALGLLRVRLSSGDVSAEDLVRADVSVSSGKTRLELVRNDAQINSSSGGFVARSIGGHLTASLASGDVDVDELAGDADVGTASGDVRIRRCDGSVLAIRTISGDILVALPEGIRVDPEISTMSGKVSLPSPANTPSGGAERRRVRLRLRSVSGDIRIERAQ